MGLRMGEGVDGRDSTLLRGDRDGCGAELSDASALARGFSHAPQPHHQLP